MVNAHDQADPLLMDHIDYDPVAEIYDLYAAATYDYDFFLSRVTPHMPVLELTSGTGRLSIPLAKAGVVLTCVDISQGMLKVLERKLQNEGLNASMLCADVQHLKFAEEFEVAILPFQSFMELVGREKQLNCLRSVYRALVPGGRFYCTMHNPTVRRTVVDGILRGVGTFKYLRGFVVVSGFETGGDPVVRRSQFIERFDEAGRLESRILQPMEFEMIPENAFRDAAREAGFKVNTVFGGYDAQPFNTDNSPLMIWELEK
jgi:ubiquinone/menaquinone biosynthesis C-methylase UbiE